MPPVGQPGSAAVRLLVGLVAPRTPPAGMDPLAFQEAVIRGLFLSGLRPSTGTWAPWKRRWSCHFVTGVPSCLPKWNVATTARQQMPSSDALASILRTRNRYCTALVDASGTLTGDIAAPIDKSRAGASPTLQSTANRHAFSAHMNLETAADRF